VCFDYSKYYSGPLSTREKDVARALAVHGVLNIRKLPTQSAPAEGAETLTVFCLPGVFPSSREFPDLTKEVYTQKNFTDVFEYVCAQSGWRVTEKTEGSRSAQVNGPPGSGKCQGHGVTYRWLCRCAVVSGKSIAAYAALRYLATQYGKMIIYIPLKVAGACAATTVAVFYNDLIFWVDLRFSVGNEQVKVVHAAVDAIVTLLEPHAVFLDGYHHALQQYGRSLTKLYGDTLEYIGVTCSMSTKELLLRELQSEPLYSSPWSMADYMHAAQVMRLSATQLRNIGCDERSTIDELKLALKAKFLVAGHCCRLMLDYDFKQAFRKLEVACSRASKSSLGEVEASPRAINTLIVTWHGKLVPVSVMAAVLMGHYGLGPESTDPLFGNIQRAVKDNSRALLGWLFEQEVLDRLVACAEHVEPLTPLSAPRSAASPASSAPASTTTVVAANPPADATPGTAKNTTPGTADEARVDLAAGAASVISSEAASKASSRKATKASKSSASKATVACKTSASKSPGAQTTVDAMASAGALATRPVEVPSSLTSAITSGQLPPHTAALLSSLGSNPRMRSATPPFVLYGRNHAVHDIPAKFRVLRFANWQDLVTRIADIIDCGVEADTHLVVLPKHYANRFFDFAVAAILVASPRTLNMTSYQATVAKSHSCDATIIQKVCDGLAKRDVRMPPVTHHAVLPSSDTAEIFQFEEGIALKKGQKPVRAKKRPQVFDPCPTVATKKQRAADPDVGQAPRAADPDEVTHRIRDWGSAGLEAIPLYQEDPDLGAEEEDGDAGDPWADAADFTWTEVVVGETLVLGESYTALAERKV
jgi:hypothetical protein